MALTKTRLLKHDFPVHGFLSDASYLPWIVKQCSGESALTFCLGGQKRFLCPTGSLPPTENNGFWRKRRKWRMGILSTRTEALLLRPLKKTKMTKITTVTHAKTLFAKNPVSPYPLIFGGEDPPHLFRRRSVRNPLFYSVLGGMG